MIKVFQGNWKHSLYLNSVFLAKTFSLKIDFFRKIWNAFIHSLCWCDLDHSNTNHIMNLSQQRSKEMNSFFIWQKGSKTAYLHKAIHYNTVKTIYIINIWKNTQATSCLKIFRENLWIRSSIPWAKIFYEAAILQLQHY